MYLFRVPALVSLICSALYEITASQNINTVWNMSPIVHVNSAVVKKKKKPVSFVNLNCVCVTLDIKRTLGQQPLNLIGYYTFVRMWLILLLLYGSFCGTLVI